MDSRKEALQILSELTPLRIEKQQNRTRRFITSPKADQPPSVLPQDWPEGWCVGWAFAVHPSLAEAMDIRIVTRSKTDKVLDADGRRIQKRSADGNLVFKENGRPDYEAIKTTWLEWSQGAAFDFHERTIVHDAPEAWSLPWGEALQHINYSLQIIDAIPASPAVAPVAEQKATSLKPYRPAKEGVLRYRGEVTFQIYRPNTDCTAIERHGEPRTVSQDEFVRILITGNLQAQE